MSERNPVVEAIHDLTRVTIALSGKTSSKADAIRRLSELSIPPSRIAAIMALPLKAVTSVTARERKRSKEAD